MFECKLYQTTDNELWNSFNESAYNGHFMFHRSYMDYHSDRFNDYSVMVYIKDSGKLYACIPASTTDRMVISHGGLTFGNIITAQPLATSKSILLFHCYLSFLETNGLQEVVLKLMPNFYKSIPSQELEYVLFLTEANCIARSASSLIRNTQKLPTKKRTGANKSRSMGYTCQWKGNPEHLMKLVNNNLIERHGVKCVHSTEEMKTLYETFQSNIEMLFVHNSRGDLVAGSVIYLNKNIAHTQYITVSTSVRKDRVLDLIMEELYERYNKSGLIIEFGISTTENGKILNKGLIKQKEEYGAYTVCYEQYLVNTRQGRMSLEKNI